jgi:DNA-binding LacI/PurR family transcriptional regulator
MNEKQPLTMKDIAAHLGVSVATVSRALKNSPNISKKRREMIQQYAREHDYYPNVIAEQLRHSRQKPSQIIGVILPEIVHFYFASILSGIEEKAKERGYRIMVAQSRESYEREVEICESFKKNKVCGIIVSQAKDTVQYDHFIKLVNGGIPLVFYDRICPALNANRVVVDDYQGAYKAVSYMIETGCRRVAFYGSNMNMEISKNRFNGYKDALYHHGLKPEEELIRQCDTREAAEELTPSLLRMKNRPDGFFAINDETAIGIMYTAKRMGIKVPDEVAVCGFTDSERAISCDPMLTTVKQNGQEVGAQAADVLIDLVEGNLSMDHAEKRMVRTQLVVMGTTK